MTKKPRQQQPQKQQEQEKVRLAIALTAPTIMGHGSGKVMRDMLIMHCIAELKVLYKMVLLMCFCV